jgi:hypothetical protein
MESRRFRDEWWPLKNVLHRLVNQFLVELGTCNQPLRARQQHGITKGQKPVLLRNSFGVNVTPPRPNE